MAEYVKDGDRPDQILFLEHNPVFTLGRSANRADIHLAEGFLPIHGLEVHQINRGGQVTYHGPGQIVVYPICNLRRGRQDVNRLVYGLEQAMIETARSFGVATDRIAGYPGVWVKTERGPEKLGAVGIHLRRWVSTHGIAFNLDPDMSHFQWITPCGISEMGVCSLRTILGEGCPSWNMASEYLARNISEMLAIEAMTVEEPSKSISATIWRRGTNGREVLVMMRNASEGQGWSSVTGMVEDGETQEEAAHRKTLEETGLRGQLAHLGLQHTFWIDPVLTHIQPSESHKVDEPRFNTETCFHIEVPADSQVVMNRAEHGEYRWCAPEDAMQLMSWEGSKTALNTLARGWR
ncbi:MAG: lipoyl(octanoyl) transferase LipB [Holophagaceae bacterium]|nr:lipoyl(octanoyl) transferase LipB [Holophagaceae bacterium]